MNSRIHTQQQGEQAKVSRPHRKTVQMLKDLIRVNKDRIAGYEKAAYEENKSHQENKPRPEDKPDHENNHVENAMDPDLRDSDLRDSDLRNLLYRMALASRSYVNDLHAEIIRLGGAPVTQDTITGKIYLFWLDCKADFGSKLSSDAFLLLDAYVCGEEAVQKVYRQALETTDDWPDNILHLLQRQLGDLERAHEQLKKTRSEYNDKHRPL